MQPLQQLCNPRQEPQEPRYLIIPHIRMPIPQPTVLPYTHIHASTVSHHVLPSCPIFIKFYAKTTALRQSLLVPRESAI